MGASGRLRNGLPTLADPASHEGAVAPSAVPLSEPYYGKGGVKDEVGAQ